MGGTGGLFDHPNVVLNPKLSARNIDGTLSLEGIHRHLVKRESRATGFGTQLQAISRQISAACR
jgi:hypothetical protein